MKPKPFNYFSAIHCIIYSNTNGNCDLHQLILRKRKGIKDVGFCSRVWFLACALGLIWYEKVAPVFYRDFPCPRAPEWSCSARDPSSHPHQHPYVSCSVSTPHLLAHIAFSPESRTLKPRASTAIWQALPKTESKMFCCILPLCWRRIKPFFLSGFEGTFSLTFFSHCYYPISHEKHHKEEGVYFGSLTKECSLRLWSTVGVTAAEACDSCSHCTHSQEAENSKCMF